MKFYKKSNGKWMLGDKSIPCGTCIEHVDSNGLISISDMQGTVYAGSKRPIDFENASGVAYADFATYEAATADFFVKATSSGCLGVAYRMATASLNAPTTSSIVPFDTSMVDEAKASKGLISYSGGSFLLKAGRTYRLMGTPGMANFSSTSGIFRYGWRTGNVGGSGTWIGVAGALVANNIAATSNYGNVAIGYYTPTVDTYVHLGVIQSNTINWVSNTGEGQSSAWAEIQVMI